MDCGGGGMGRSLQRLVELPGSVCLGLTQVQGKAVPGPQDAGHRLES